MRKLVLVMTFGLLVGLLAIGPASAAAADVCPDGDGWVKYEGLDGLSFTIPEEDIPEGYEVTENCMKVGSHDPVFGSGTTVENTTLTNQNGKLQDISHASFLLQQVTTTTVDDTTTTTLDDTTTTTVDESTTTTVDESTTTTVDESTTTTACSRPSECEPDVTLTIPPQPPNPPTPSFNDGGFWCHIDGTSIRFDTIEERQAYCGPVVPADPADPVETLPFTGPEMIAPLSAIGGSLAVVGSALVAAFRRRDDE